MNPAALLLLTPPEASAGTSLAGPPASMDAPRPAPAGGNFSAALQAAAQKTGLSPALLQAVEHQESGGDPTAVSGAGAIGLMQLMPGTAAGLGVNPWDPAQNLVGGATYLADQLQHFGGNLPDALAAYNAGPGAIEMYGGIPPYVQTQHYVAAVMTLYREYSATPA